MLSTEKNLHKYLLVPLLLLFSDINIIISQGQIATKLHIKPGLYNFPPSSYACYQKFPGMWTLLVNQKSKNIVIKNKIKIDEWMSCVPFSILPNKTFYKNDYHLSLPSFHQARAF